MTLFRLRPVGRTIGHEGGRHRAAMTGRGKGRVARKKLALARARLVGVFSHPSSQIFDSSPAAVPSGTFVSNRRRRRALARALSRGGVSRRLPSTPASDIRGSFKKKTTRRIVVEPNTSLRARGDVDGEKTVATPPRPKNAGTRTPDRRAAFTAALSGEALHSSERALLPARARERSLRLVPSRDASSSGVPIVARNDARARHPRLLFFTNTRYGTPRRASSAREPRLSGSPRAASSCSASPATWRSARRSPPP